MRYITCYLLILVLCTGVQPARASEPPTYAMWFDCVYRGEYPGRAEAAISYRYDGSEPIAVEDARWFGDTSTGNTIVQPMIVQPGEHLRMIRVNVGALKVLTLKVVLFGSLHVVTAYDHPEFPNCPLDEQPTPEPVATWGSA